MRRELGDLLRTSTTVSLQSPTQPNQEELFSKPAFQGLFTTLHIAYVQSPFPSVLIQYTNLVDSMIGALGSQGEKK